MVYTVHNMPCIHNRPVQFSSCLLLNKKWGAWGATHIHHYAHTELKTDIYPQRMDLEDSFENLCNLPLVNLKMVSMSNSKAPANLRGINK